MKTLSVAVTDTGYREFGFANEVVPLAAFLAIIRKELMRQNLQRCTELARKYGLADMSMDEITDEVRPVRQNAKSRR
jgi:hypothetical protein